MRLALPAIVAAFVAGMCGAELLTRAAAAYYRWRVSRLRREIEMIREHQRRFPGRCTVCAFHRYGVTQGFENPRSMPQPHHCPEVN